MKLFFPKTLLTVLGIGLLLTVLASYVQAEADKNAKRIFTKHFQETLFDISKKAEFSIEILLDDKEYKIGKNVIGVVVHNANDKDVEKAAISIDFRNSDTGRPSTQTPVVKEKGEGLYIVSDLDLKKEGHWKLTIKVKKDGIEDSVQFLLPDALKTLHPAGKYSP
ncbi:MAG TPA: FixH family protein [Thermodesulfovibrionales bacterium]|nr:FixH family protein [Thermodesulfovibrionales bacterium]